MEQDLMRLLHGELSAAESRELRDQMRSDPDLAASYRRLEANWRRLELPPASPIPPGYASRVMAHVRSEPATGSLAWSAAPGWVRAAAAAALVAGAALGLGVGRSWPAPQSGVTAVSAAASSSPSEEEDYTLAESYWSLVADATSETEERP